MVQDEVLSEIDRIYVDCVLASINQRKSCQTLVSSFSVKITSSLFRRINKRKEKRDASQVAKMKTPLNQVGTNQRQI